MAQTKSTDWQTQNQLVYSSTLCQYTSDRLKTSYKLGGNVFKIRSKYKGTVKVFIQQPIIGENNDSFDWSSSKKCVYYIKTTRSSWLSGICYLISNLVSSDTVKNRNHLSCMIIYMYNEINKRDEILNSNTWFVRIPIGEETRFKDIKD